MRPAAAPRARLCSRCCAAPLPPLRAGAVIARAELVSGVLTPACGQLLRTLATDRARTAVERYTQQREAWPEVRPRARVRRSAEGHRGERRKPRACFAATQHRSPLASTDTRHAW